MSLFVTPPPWILLFFPKERPRLWVPLWLTTAAVAIPGFFYQNTGYYQFGYRFSLDYTPYLVLLLAIGGRALAGPFSVLPLAFLPGITCRAPGFNRPCAWPDFRR